MRENDRAFIAIFALVLVPIVYLVLALFSSFWHDSVQTICRREWMGHPSVAVVMALNWFLFIVLHWMIVWILVLRPFAPRKT